MYYLLFFDVYVFTANAILLVAIAEQHWNPQFCLLPPVLHPFSGQLSFCKNRDREIFLWF